MTRNFYFQNEADIVTGAVSFANLVSISPETYGISPEQSASFGLLSATLKSAFVTASEPSTRTSVAVAAKKDALKAMRANAIMLAGICYAQKTVSDAELVALGLLPRASRTARPMPGEAPALNILGVNARIVSLRVSPAGSTRRGKPFGTSGANLYSFVGDNPPSDPRDYHFEGVTTRAKTQIIFPDNVPSGATVWLSACWVGTRGKTGPACSPVSSFIQGGNVLPIAV